MRIALLSALKTTPIGVLRAELELVGRSVLAWQVDLMKALGCDRIICIGDPSSAAMRAAQEQAESTQIDFYVISSNTQLAALIRSQDEVVVLCDGLVADVEAAKDFAQLQDGILTGLATLPAAHAMAQFHPEDFERIDRERHWAGLAIIDGRAVQGLADLPPDSAAISSLLRLGLQKGVPCRDMLEDHLLGSKWLLCDDLGFLSAREREIVLAAVPSASQVEPAHAIGAFLLRQIGAGGLKRGAEASAALALVIFGLAIALGASGLPAWGLGAGCVGVFCVSLSQRWFVLRERVWSVARRVGLSRLLDGLVFIVSAVLLVMALGPQQEIAFQLGLPVLALGVIAHAGHVSAERFGAFWRDRTSHLAILTIALVLGILPEGLIALPLCALISLILRQKA